MALPTSLKNDVVIENGGSIFLCTPSWRVYNFDVHSPFLIITCLVHLQTLMLKLRYSSGLLGSIVFEVCQSSLLCFSNPHS